MNFSRLQGKQRYAAMFNVIMQRYLKTTDAIVSTACKIECVDSVKKKIGQINNIAI